MTEADVDGDAMEAELRALRKRSAVGSGRGRRALVAVVLVAVGLAAVVLVVRQTGNPADAAASSATTTGDRPLANATAGAVGEIGRTPGVVAPSSDAMPDGRSFNGVSVVGALFAGSDLTGNAHFCTASVVDSPAGDLVLTAAHCVRRSFTDLVFVPGYADGKAPYGEWQVTRVLVDRAWATTADPDDDFALLIVRPHGRTSLEQVTGADRLGVGAASGQRTAVDGYPDGASRPVTCVNTDTLFSRTQFQFDCGGYPDGTSGSPFLVGVDAATGHGTVVGVIGGYEQGGDTPQVSYAARFGANMSALYGEATHIVVA